MMPEAEKIKSGGVRTTISETIHLISGMRTILSNIEEIVYVPMPNCPSKDVVASSGVENDCRKVYADLEKILERMKELANRLA